MGVFCKFAVVRNYVVNLTNGVFLALQFLPVAEPRDRSSIMQRTMIPLLKLPDHLRNDQGFERASTLSLSLIQKCPVLGFERL